MARILRRLQLYPLLGLAALHTLMTGSPVPLWYVEELENAKRVITVSETALVLHDGRQFELPYIKSIPQDSRLFREALKHGVEIGPDGEVTGLLRIQRHCGNDPVAYRRLRVNLTDLAGVLNPSGIDDGVVSSDVIDHFREEFAHITESVRVDVFLLVKMKRIRQQFELSSGKASEDQYETIGRPGQHDRRSGGLLL